MAVPGANFAGKRVGSKGLIFVETFLSQISRLRATSSHVILQEHVVCFPSVARS